MTDNSQFKQKIEQSSGGGWIALAILIVYFFGTPDLNDLVVELVKNLQVSRPQ